MTKAEKQYRKRFALATALALLFHAAVFLAVQYLLPLRIETLPEYGGPITVTIGENEAAAAPAAPAEVDAGVPNPPARSETRPPEAPRAEAGSPSVTAAAAKPPRPVVESREVPKTFEPVLSERPLKIKPLPDKPPLVKLPPMEESADNPLPFEPKTTVAESPSSINITKNNEAPAKTKLVASADSSPSAKVKGGSKGSSQSESESGKSATGEKQRGQGEASSTDGAGASPAGSPLTWEIDGPQREIFKAATLPKIPNWVYEAAIDLTVIVTFEVTPEGQTTGILTAKSSGYADVDAAVLDEVRKMVFYPAPGAGISRGTVNYIIDTKEKK
jgi:TonB family protein